MRVANTSSTSWLPREGFALAVVNASVFLAGGWGGGSASYLQDVWTTIDAGLSWTLVTASAPWAARGYFEMVLNPP